MRSAEAVAIVYAGYLVAVVVLLPSMRKRRPQIVALAAVVLVLVVLHATLEPLATIRDWMPAALVLLGYWMSGAFFSAPMRDVEAWLIEIDRRLFARMRLDSMIRRSPRVALELLELAYACCYPLVPAGYAVLAVAGFGDQADRYWTTVLASELGCYAMLPWLQTRPPRAIETAPAVDERRLLMRRLNLGILGRGSIGVNTIPSGHAAGALAAALAVLPFVPAAGVVFLLLAVAIGAGSFVGRYHYMVDVMSGYAVAILVALGVAFM